MSSIKPDDGSSQVNGGQEISGGFVIRGGDGAVLFEAGEEVFDQMALLVEGVVLVARVLAIAARRDTNALARFLPRKNDPFIGIKRLVGYDQVRFDFR